MTSDLPSPTHPGTVLEEMYPFCKVGSDFLGSELDSGSYLISIQGEPLPPEVQGSPVEPPLASMTGTDGTSGSAVDLVMQQFMNSIHSGCDHPVKPCPCTRLPVQNPVAARNTNQHLGQVETTVVSSKFLQQQPTVNALFWPLQPGVSAAQIPAARQIVLPDTFTCVRQYEGLLTSALVRCYALFEHANVKLGLLAQKFDRLYRSITCAATPDASTTAVPHCAHGQMASQLVKKDGPNQAFLGRMFYCCPRRGSDECKGSFTWAGTRSGHNITDPQLRLSYFRSHGIQYYSSCSLRYVHPFVTRSGQHVPGHWQLQLPTEAQQEASGQYQQDDLWLICKMPSFEVGHNGVSMMSANNPYGPWKGLQVEMRAIGGLQLAKTYHQNIFAIRVEEFGTELGMLKMVQTELGSAGIPVLSALLNPLSPCPAQRGGSTEWLGGKRLPAGQVLEVAQNYAGQYKLNDKQIEVLLKCSSWVADDPRAVQYHSEFPTTNRLIGLIDSPIVLVHGVFGSGKSLLVSVIVLVLIRLFELLDVGEVDPPRTQAEDPDLQCPTYPVLGSTCCSSVKLSSKKLCLHVLIIDECSQCIEPLALLPAALLIGLCFKGLPTLDSPRSNLTRNIAVIPASMVYTLSPGVMFGAKRLTFGAASLILKKSKPV
eukprot:gene5389-134_t